MTGAQAGVFAVWVMTSIVLSFLVFMVLPALARTTFRARLDMARDDCMDAVLAGKLAMSRPVEEFLRSLDVLNRVARQLTFLRVALIVTTLHRLNADVTAYQGVSFAELEASERRIMHDLAKKVNVALTRYLMWGSPIGWVIAPLAAYARRQDRKRTPLRLDKVAAEFNRSGAFNDLPIERVRRLQRVA